MIQKRKYLICLVNVILMVSCIIHIISIIESIFNPKLPTIKVFKRNLSDMKFPLSFKICFEGDGELKLYEKLGYNNKKDLIRGTSKYNDSIIGWTGHRADGFPFGTIEGYILSSIMKFLVSYLQMLYQI